MKFILLRKRNRGVALSFLGALPSGSVFFRASDATRFDNTGTMVLSSVNVPRFDYDPVTLAIRGLLLEGQRTNYIVNSTMQGGGAGVLPTGWGWASSQSGIARTIVGVGVEYGMPYIDLRFAGTASASGTNTLYFSTSGGFPSAAQGNVWTVSFFARIVGGSLSNITSMDAGVDELQSSGTFVAGSADTMLTTVSSTLALHKGTRTLTSAATAYASGKFRVAVTNGATANITVRIYLPQFEKAASATSRIPTYGAIATRYADVLYTTSIPWFNASAGTFEVEAIYEGLPPSNTYGYLAAFDDGTTGNVMAIMLNSSSQKMAGSNVGGTTYLSATGAAASVNTVMKAAYAYKSGANIFAFDGVALGAGALGAANIPSGINRLDFADRLGSGLRASNIWLRGFKFYPYPVSQPQLLRVTK